MQTADAAGGHGSGADRRHQAMAAKINSMALREINRPGNVNFYQKTAKTLLHKLAKFAHFSEQHLLKANRLLPQGAGMASVLLKRASTLELDWDVRQKSRFDALDSLGRPVGVFLPHGTLVRGGDVLLWSKTARWCGSLPRRKPCCASRPARRMVRPST